MVRENYGFILNVLESCSLDGILMKIFEVKRSHLLMIDFGGAHKIKNQQMNEEYS